MLYRKIVLENTTHLKAVQEKKYQFLIAMLNQALKNIDKGYISKDITKKIIKNLIVSAMIGENKSKDIKLAFQQEYGIGPPHFLVVSPTLACNLKCTGCYASVGKENAATLPWENVDKILKEAHDKLGIRFITISGGEPFLYQSGNKTLFDAWEKYNDMYFLVYTNGTFITPEVAAKLAKLGNVTPAISIEGFEKETDARRGKGTHAKILAAMGNLRKAGVPFGISVTATNKNVKTLLNDKFWEFYFESQGATYAWQFQLMPIGKAKDCLDLIVTPKNRVKLYGQWEHLMADKKYCIADFWNSGVLSDGCVAYGSKKGYLYIDWNGNIMPCVFVPYYVDNIKDLHAQGKGLTEALFSKFFKNGRKWQEEYGTNDTKHPQNWLMPCSIRDHFDNWKKNIYTTGVKPENNDAASAIKDKEYEKFLKNFDDELEKVTEPIWKKKYLKTKP